jgi:sulfur-oxidizing protein SoxA
MAGLAALLAAAAGAGLAWGQARSGIEFASRETQAMQAEDAANPGMLWVLEGEQLWQRAAGAAGRSCQDCHGDAAAMRGVAARYPAYDGRQDRPLDLTSRINNCRAEHQQAPRLGYEDPQMLALTAFVAHQSRGLPIAPDQDPRSTPLRENGRRIYEQRMGQLDLACASCHDAHAAGRLGGSAITQGQVNGYPLYRLEWQSLGSLRRRLRNCMIGIRAEPFAEDASDLIDLELYLTARGAGLPIETPAVRP